MRPEAAAQSPEAKCSSTTAMAFCMKMEGMELTMALTRIQISANGSSLG